MEWVESPKESPDKETKKTKKRVKKTEDKMNQEEIKLMRRSQEGNQEDRRNHTKRKTHIKPKVIQTTLSSVGNFLSIRTTLTDQAESSKAVRICKTNKKLKGKGASQNGSTKPNLSKLDKNGQI